MGTKKKEQSKLFLMSIVIKDKDGTVDKVHLMMCTLDEGMQVFEDITKGIPADFEGNIKLESIGEIIPNCYVVDEFNYWEVDVDVGEKEVE